LGWLASDSMASSVGKISRSTFRCRSNDAIWSISRH
jgi:hypothetical protein